VQKKGRELKNRFHVEGIHKSVSRGTSCGRSPEEGFLSRLSKANLSGYSADNEWEKLAWTSHLDRQD
jgi:hypothetical protein